MWPLLFLGLWGFLHVVMNERRTLAGAPPITKLSGEKLPPPTPLQRLALLARAKRPIPTALLNDALHEAYARGDWKVIDAISKRLEASSGTPTVVTSGEDTTSIVIGRNSPIDGVSNEEWEAFIEKLKTQTADYSTDKHIGAYHHHRERLQQLGIDPTSLADEEAQYQALAKDIASYSSAERKLIADFGGELIDIPGTSSLAADGSSTHCVSMSGVLGVLKAAGPKNARAWFKSAKDREDHPKTTAAFLATNGVF